MKARYFERAKVHSMDHKFSFFLDEVPPRAAAGSTIVNPAFHFQTTPAEVVRGEVPLDAFLEGYPIAWVKDTTDVWLPYWSRGAWNEVLQRLRPGEAAPNDLDPRVRDVLIAAKILVGRDDKTGKACDEARAHYAGEGYVVLRDVFDPLYVAAVRRYYRALVERGGLPLGDDQVADRYVVHSEVLASFFHPQLATLVARIAGEAVRPSYVYFASYKPGAALPKHVDREQCEFSISFLADYDPDCEGPCGWPLFLEDPRRKKKAAIDLGIGDALFYRGRSLAHSRDALPEGHRSTSLFFHYVRPDFAGELW